ncbi:MAG: hypothetical protein JWM87_663 [Candidatus Eremiobacteraeota bacterium]|nr:hypothetical protein [Candidatus Eremiobacteraeota bacterium]
MSAHATECVGAIELGVEAEPLVDVLIEVEARNAAAREREITQTA